MAADFESLKILVSESRATLVSAARTIRALIVQRDQALAAANPDDVKAVQETQRVATTAADLQAGLEQDRLDTEAAISEAGALK
jgi:hypothetical protein